MNSNHRTRLLLSTKNETSAFKFDSEIKNISPSPGATWKLNPRCHLNRCPVPAVTTFLLSNHSDEVAKSPRDNACLMVSGKRGKVGRQKASRWTLELADGNHVSVTL